MTTTSENTTNGAPSTAPAEPGPRVTEDEVRKLQIGGAALLDVATRAMKDPVQRQIITYGALFAGMGIALGWLYSRSAPTGRADNSTSRPPMKPQFVLGNWDPLTASFDLETPGCDDCGVGRRFHGRVTLNATPSVPRAIGIPSALPIVKPAPEPETGKRPTST